MRNFDIFISYSSKDKSVTDQLVAFIEKAGYACWLAPRNIEGGAEYSEVIEKAILGCKIFLIVFSEHSEKSPWVKSELNIAFSENKYLIPYKIDATPLKGTMRLLLNDKHWIDKCENEHKQLYLLLSAIQNYIAILEKGRTDQHLKNPYYHKIARRKKIRRIIVSFFAIALLFLIGGVGFEILFPRLQNIKTYTDFVEQATAIQGISINDYNAKKHLLHKAQKIENEIPVSKRKDISEILFLINFKLDSIYYQNLDEARMFASLETANGDNQATERYKIALQAKEDTAARNELNIILSRKGIYE